MDFNKKNEPIKNIYFHDKFTLISDIEIKVAK